MKKRFGIELWVDESSCDAKGKPLLRQIMERDGDEAEQCRLVMQTVSQRLAACDVDVAGGAMLPDESPEDRRRAKK